MTKPEEQTSGLIAKVRIVYSVFKHPFDGSYELRKIFLGPDPLYPLIRYESIGVNDSGYFPEYGFNFPRFRL